MDEDSRPLANTLIEIWQPRCRTLISTKSISTMPSRSKLSRDAGGHNDAEGRYRFVTFVRENIHGAIITMPGGRRIFIFRCSVRHWTRLVTQMFFRAIHSCRLIHFNCTADEKARNRLISVFDWETTVPMQALGYRFDIVFNAAAMRLRWRTQVVGLQVTTIAAVGPFFHIGCHCCIRTNWPTPGIAGVRVTIQGRVLDGDGVPVPDAFVEIWQANSHGKYAHREDTQDKHWSRDSRFWARSG